MIMFKLVRVEITDRAYKEIQRIPRHIVDKLQTWIDAVKLKGLERVRHISGYHDEPLKGDRVGQRSIRLNRSYRAIYEVIYGEATIVRIEEVTKHVY